MPVVTGTVKAISTKSGEGKFGPWTLYNMKIAETNGQENWYGFGNKHPGVREETHIQFFAKKNQKGYWEGDKDTIELVDGGQAPAPAAPRHNQAAAPQSAPSAPARQVDRQSSITLQTAFKVSTDLVNGMMAAGIYKPPLNSQDKKEKAQEMTVALVEKLAARFHPYFNDPEGFIESQLSDAAKDAVNEGESDEDMFD